MLLLAALGCATPSGTAPAAAPAATRHTDGTDPRLHGALAVLEFEVVKGVDIDRLYFSDKVRGAVGRLAPGLFVMTRESTEVLLTASGKTSQECEGECEVEIGRRLAADYVISGRITKVGTRLVVTLRMHSTGDARMLGSEEVQGRGADDLVDGCDAAVARLLGLRGQAAARPPPTATAAPSPAPRPVAAGFIDVAIVPRSAAKLARISIDGKPSRSGKQGPFAPGWHDVRAEARDYSVAEETAAVEDGQTARVVLELIPVEDRAPPPVLQSQPEQSSARPAPRPCQDLSGNWRRPDGNVWQLKSSGCSVSGLLDSPAFLHTLSGDLDASAHTLATKIMRTNRGNGCTTAMFTTLSVLDDQSLIITSSSSDGRCDLPPSFSESFLYHRQ